MTFQIEKDEDTAVNRIVPIRIFTSDGTSPDTGASNDTIMISVNGAAQISGGSVSAVSAAAGQYYIQPTQSNVSVLGSIAAWYDLGDFPQHVANIQVVNSNPFSTQSNHDLSANTIAGDTNTATLIGALNDIDGSNVTLFAGTHPSVVIPTVTALSSGVTVATGGIIAASFGVGALDAAAIASDAGDEIADAFLDRNMATGTDSGSSAVRTARDALRALRNRVVLSGNTLTVYEEDDTTAKWTASLVTTGDSNFPTAMDPNS